MNFDLSRKLEGMKLLPIWAIAIGATCQWHLILRSRSPSKWLFKFKPYLFCDPRTQKILGRTAKDEHRCVIDLNISGLIRPVLPIWQNCLSCFGMWVQAVARSHSHGCERQGGFIVLRQIRYVVAQSALFPNIYKERPSATTYLGSFRFLFSTIKPPCSHGCERGCRAIALPSMHLTRW